MKKDVEGTTPPRSRLRTLMLAVAGLGCPVGLVWLGFTGFPLISLVPLVALSIVAAALFSRREEPSKRLEQLIKALWRDR